MTSKQSSLRLICNLKTINILKITIICTIGITMILFFDPFYERTEDSYIYGVSAMRTINEEYAFGNELLQNNEHREFVPRHWLKTNQGDIIPVASGMSLISSAIYSVFGLYGLFYFGPIATIILLIVSERVTTKLFGDMVGLITLLFLATSELTIFLILGIFYLVKFYQYKKEKYILLASIFFAFTTFIRVNGMVALPIEAFVILLVLYNQKQSDSFLIQIKNNLKWYQIKKNFQISTKINKNYCAMVSFIHLYFFIQLIFFWSPTRKRCYREFKYNLNR